MDSSSALRSRMGIAQDRFFARMAMVPVSSPCPFAGGSMDPITSPIGVTVKNPLALSHGWSLELTCPTCQKRAKPRVTGWVPSHELHFGNTPTIYSTLHCGHCGTDLKAAAGDQLVELFSPVAIPAENRLLLFLFVAALAGLPIGFCLFLALGIWLEWWSSAAFQWLALFPVLAGPLIIWFNRRVATLRQKCPCSQPDFEFMGMLGRSYCHRCRNCGDLLRLRD